MISLSPGIAQGTFDLLRLVAKTQLTFKQIAASFSHFGPMRSSEIIEFVQSNVWACPSDDGFASLTPTGARLIGLSGYEAMLRQTLLDHVDASKPAWVQAASYGRSRVLSFAGSGVAQVIVEAGLANDFSDDVVAFWDALSARASSIRDAAMTAIGRTGERLTIEHEKLRTGRTPKWVAINSNADGYDVLSVVDATDGRFLSIEVKTSTMGPSGHLHLTRNEWEMAQERLNHVFHLWDTKSAPPRLAKISVAEMSHHVASDSGNGRWEVTSIPFSVFGPFEPAALSL